MNIKEKFFVLSKYLVFCSSNQFISSLSLQCLHFRLPSRSSKNGASLIEPKLNKIPSIHFKSRALLQFDNSNDIDYEEEFDAPFRGKQIQNLLRQRYYKDQPIKFRRKSPLLSKLNNELLEEELLQEHKMFPSLESDCDETFNKTDANR